MNAKINSHAKKTLRNLEKILTDEIDCLVVGAGVSGLEVAYQTGKVKWMNKIKRY